MSALTSTRKLLQKGRTFPQESSKTGFPRKVTAAEEHSSLVTVPLSDAPPSQVFAEVAPLSDSDKEIEQYIEQILTDVVVEVPLVLVPSNYRG